MGETGTTITPGGREAFLEAAKSGKLEELQDLPRPPDTDLLRAFELAVVNNRAHTSYRLAPRVAGVITLKDLLRIREELGAKGNSAGIAWLTRTFPVLQERAPPQKRAVVSPRRHPASPAKVSPERFPDRPPEQVMSLRGAEDWMLRTTYFVNNECLQRDFYALMRASEAGEDIEDLRSQVLKEAKRLENKQWSEHIHNVIDWHYQCPHECRYCYMKVMREHRHAETRRTADVEDPSELLAARAKKGWATARRDADRKLFMFPTSNDIIPQIVPAYLAQARRMLKAGHGLIIVSKPHLDVMRQLADAFANDKRRVVFRLTIGSADPDVLYFWEPGAPPLEERVSALRMLHERGFITSVSAEPFLSDPRPLVKLVEPYVSETIWLGPMSGFTGPKSGKALREQEVEWRATPAGRNRTSIIDLLQPGYLYQLVHDLAANPKIYWKTSIIIPVAKLL